MRCRKAGSGRLNFGLLLIAANVALLRNPVVMLGGHRLFLLDVGGTIGVAGMAVMLALTVARHTFQLYGEEPL